MTHPDEFPTAAAVNEQDDDSSIAGIGDTPFALQNDDDVNKQLFRVEILRLDIAQDACNVGDESFSGYFVWNIILLCWEHYQLASQKRLRELKDHGKMYKRSLQNRKVN